jgi:hypothetical protein
VVDALQVGNWQRSAANSKKKPPKPKPIPRPGAGAKQTKRKATGIPLSEAKQHVATQPAWQPPDVCYEPDCGRRVKARRMCAKHYQRWWRHQAQVS